MAGQRITEWCKSFVANATDKAYLITKLGVAALSSAVSTFTGAVLSSAVGGPAAAGIGYTTGAGGAVTQTTNRTTGVTLNTMCGQVTTHTASLAAEAAAEFTVTNSSVVATDVINTSIQSGSNGGATEVIVSGVANGSFKLKVINNNAAGGTAETGAIVVNFAVFRSSIT